MKSQPCLKYLQNLAARGSVGSNTFFLDTVEVFNVVSAALFSNTSGGLVKPRPGLMFIFLTELLYLEQISASFKLFLMFQVEF